MQPSQHVTIQGRVAAPSSKSMMQRALALACLSDGQVLIQSPSLCDDGLAAIGIVKALGADVVLSADGILVVPTPFSRNPIELDCYESGLSMRMFSAVAALCETEVTLVGHGSLLSRPVTMIEAPLRQLGAKVSTSAGYPPLVVTGPLKGGEIIVDGSVSSQFITGLLIALPKCKQDSRLLVTNLKSKPYVEMTLQIVRQFGGVIEANEELTEFAIPGNQQFHGDNYRIEGDWSGASFLLVAGALAGEVTVANLRTDSAQADLAILEALRRSGAMVEVAADSVTVAMPKQGQMLRAFEFDATECPDLFPPLAVLAAAATGESLIHGVSRLRHKESDRATAIQVEFAKLGVEVSINNNTMNISGKGLEPLKGSLVCSYNDHRMAMALALAQLRCREKIVIDNPGCVSKSFPDFYKVLETLSKE